MEESLEKKALHGTSLNLEEAKGVLTA